MKKNGSRLRKIRLLRADEIFYAERALPYQGFQEDIAFVKEISENAAGKGEDRFFACQPLSRYHMLRGKYDLETAQALKREAERFQEKYSMPHLNVMSIPMEGLEEYIRLAQKYIRQLLECNSVVIHDIAENPKFFTDMWDYLIPAAASLLWAADATNRDAAKRREAGERGRYWVDIFFSVMVDPHGRPYLFEKWGKRGLKQYEERKEEWIGLLRDVVRRLTDIQS